MFFHMYIALGRGRQTPGVKLLTERPYHFDHLLQVLKKIPLNSDFIHILNVFSRVSSPKAGEDNAWGQNFDPNRKALSLWSFFANLQKSFSTLIFYIFLNYFIHVYSPGARADIPLRSNFWCHQKGLNILTIYCKFQNDLFEFWFYAYVLIFHACI